MKKIMALLLAALLALSAAALAEGQVRTTGSVNLRVGPGLDYDKVDAVRKGTRLDYLGETSTDERGVDWYKVDYEGQEVWISSRYSRLDAAPAAVPGADAEAVEVSGWYRMDLQEAARVLGAATDEGSHGELLHVYSNDALTLGGAELVEFIGVSGPGYSLFGAAVGMDIRDARISLGDAGLSYYGGTWCDTFQHPSDERSFVDVDGFDSCINVEYDENERVTSLDWSSYTG